MPCELCWHHRWQPCPLDFWHEKTGTGLFSCPQQFIDVGSCLFQLHMRGSCTEKCEHSGLNCSGRQVLRNTGKIDLKRCEKEELPIHRPKQIKGLYPSGEDAEVFYAVLSTMCWDRCHFPKV